MRVIVASNRGPVAFVRDDRGEVVPKRGAGGLVTALSGALAASGGIWIASAMTDDDRARAAAGAFDVEAGGSSYRLRYLAFDPDTYDRHYNGITNRVLWFLHHYLWDTPRTPSFGPETASAWEAFRQVNRAFAEALAEEGASPGQAGGTAAFLVQDYHLALVPAMLRALRPEGPIAHFSHIPFAGPSYIQILPAAYRDELLGGLLGADVLGFHSPEWVERFLLSCRTLGQARVDLRRRTVRWQGREVRVRVYPIGLDAGALEEEAGRPEVAEAERGLLEWKGEARLILRVDRAELAKNILRGFLAFDRFLERSPEWIGRVKFLALLNPSRENVPEYGAYIEECVAAVNVLNARWGDGAWQPARADVRDDYPSTIAAYRHYDALLVNSTLDGMNLVAKEGPILNRGDGPLILSETAGAFRELGRFAIPVNAFDVEQTAEAIGEALDMPAAERHRRARGLRAAVRRNPPERWVNAQLDDLGAGRPAG